MIKKAYVKENIKHIDTGYGINEAPTYEIGNYVFSNHDSKKQVNELKPVLINDKEDLILQPYNDDIKVKIEEPVNFSKCGHAYFVENTLNIEDTIKKEDISGQIIANINDIESKKILDTEENYLIQKEELNDILDHDFELTGKNSELFMELINHIEPERYEDFVKNYVSFNKLLINFDDNGYRKIDEYFLES